jgi:hypothetical protein
MEGEEREMPEALDLSANRLVALEALDIRVKVTPVYIEIAGIIPVDVKPAQSSANGQNPIHQLTFIPS